MLNAKPTSPPASVVAMMGLAPNAEAFHIGRLRHFERAPFSYEEAFYPSTLAGKSPSSICATRPFCMSCVIA